jgi:hypothetical protein
MELSFQDLESETHTENNSVCSYEQDTQDEQPDISKKYINYNSIIKQTQIKYLVFREDVIDYLDCIVSTIKKNNINTKNKYEYRLKKIVKDFGLRDILKMINYLIHDKTIKKNNDIYKDTVIYCNHILAHPIIIRSLKEQPKFTKFINP